jgi:hypothetical protein
MLAPLLVSEKKVTAIASNAAQADISNVAEKYRFGRRCCPWFWTFAHPIRRTAKCGDQAISRSEFPPSELEWPFLISARNYYHGAFLNPIKQRSSASQKLDALEAVPNCLSQGTRILRIFNG